MLLASMKPPQRGRPRWPPRLGLFCVAVAGTFNFSLAMRVNDDADVEDDLGKASQYDYSEEGTASSEAKFNSTPHEDVASSLLSSVRRAGADSNKNIGGAVTTTTTRAPITATSTTNITTPDISITFPLTTSITTTSTEIERSTEIKTTESGPVSGQHSFVTVDADDCDCSIAKDWLDVPDTVERISEVVSYSLKSLLMFVFGGLTTEQQKARIMLLDKDGSNTISEHELTFLSAYRASDLRNLLKHLNVHSFEAGLGTRISVAALAAAAEVHKVEKLNSAEGLMECQCMDGQTGFKNLPITVSHDEFRGGLLSSNSLKNITTKLASRILARFRDMVAMDLDGDSETDMWISPLLLPSEKKQRSTLADGILEIPQSAPTTRSPAVDVGTHSTISKNVMNLTENHASSSNSSNDAYTNRNQSKGGPLKHSRKWRIIKALVSSKKRKKRKKKKKKASEEKTGAATHDTWKSSGSSSEISKKVKQGKSRTNAVTDSTADAILLRQADELVKQADHQKDEHVPVSDLLRKEAEIAIKYANRKIASIRAEAIKGMRHAMGLDESEADKVHVPRMKTIRFS